IMALAFFVAAMFVPRVRELAGLPAKAKTGAGVSVGSTTTGTSTAGSIDADGSVGSAGNSAAGDRTQLLTTNGKSASASSGSGAAGALGSGAADPMVVGNTAGGFAEIMAALIKAIPGLLIPLIILGGIYGGTFTPTEAGAVASVYALVVGLFVYRELTWKDMPKVFLESGVSTAVIMFIVGVASLFSYVITVEGVAERISTAVLGVTDNKYLILAVTTIILLIVGAFVDAISAFYLFIPILVPILVGGGVDMTTLGMFMTASLASGLFTPPVG